MKCHLINKLHEVVKSSNEKNDLMKPWSTKHAQFGPMLNN